MFTVFFIKKQNPKNNDFKNRCIEIYKRDFRNYINSNKLTFDSIEIPKYKISRIRNFIMMFPGFSNCLENEYFNKVINKIDFNNNYAFTTTEDLNDWFVETIETDDSFLETFTNNVVKIIAGKVATILKKDPSKFENFKHMNFAISSYIKDMIFQSDKMDFFTTTDKYNI